MKSTLSPGPAFDDMVHEAVYNEEQILGASEVIF